MSEALESAQLSVIAGQLGTVRSRLDVLLVALGQPGWQAGQTRAELSEISAELQQLITLLRSDERGRLIEARRLEEILDVLFGLAGLDFSKRARVGTEGNVLDAVASATNMLSEELAATQHALAERNRALEAATAAKSQFMANMSHEIRTPLGALLGFAELLVDPRLSEGDRLNYALIIRRNGEHLLSLINDILDLSKIEAGKLSIELLECSLSQLLIDIAALMRVRASEKGLAFSVDFLSSVPGRILSDPTRLRQILLNLLGNAIKFTENGSVRLILSYDADPPSLAFTVVDTGIGMSPEQLSRMFQPFEQADLSMTRRFGGTGLGLAICKPLAEALGGSLTVESTEGVGSIFMLKLAIETTADSPWIQSLDAASAEDKLGHIAVPERLAGVVLLAEDGTDNQLFVSTVLSRRGLAVVLAENGQIASERALSAWRSGQPFDLILMDMQMPVLDGYSATTYLRQQGYPGPIIALTAHAMVGERERCLAAGCNDFLTKPITRQHLIEQISPYLGAAVAGTVVSDTLTHTPPTHDQGLISSYADDPEMGELIAGFVTNMPERIKTIQNAAHQPDLQALQRLTHQLKGAAGGYGFQPVTMAAARLEQALLAGQPIEPALQELVEICARLRVKQEGSDT